MLFRLILQLLTNLNGNFQPILTRAVFKQFSTPGKTQLSPNLQLQFSCSFFNCDVNIKFIFDFAQFSHSHEAARGALSWPTGGLY